MKPKAPRPFSTLPRAIFGGCVLLVCCGSLGCQAKDATSEGEQGGHAGHDGNGGHGGQAAVEDQCCILGALCHVVGDQVDAVVSECHELGHENDPVACAERFEECKTACAGLVDEPLEHACE